MCLSLLFQLVASSRRVSGLFFFFFIMVGIVRGSVLFTRPPLCLPVFWVPRLDCLGFMIHVIPAEMTGCGDRLALSLSPLSVSVCLPPSYSFLLHNEPWVTLQQATFPPVCVGRRVCAGHLRRSTAPTGEPHLLGMRYGKPPEAFRVECCFLSGF